MRLVTCPLLQNSQIVASSLRGIVGSPQEVDSALSAKSATVRRSKDEGDFAIHDHAEKHDPFEK
jgi:hypothetical protein